MASCLGFGYVSALQKSVDTAKADFFPTLAIIMHMHAKQEDSDSCTLLQPCSNTDLDGDGDGDALFFPDRWEKNFFATASPADNAPDAWEHSQAAPIFIPGGYKGLVSQAQDDLLEFDYRELPVAFIYLLPTLHLSPF